MCVFTKHSHAIGGRCSHFCKPISFHAEASVDETDGVTNAERCKAGEMDEMQNVMLYMPLVPVYRSSGRSQCRKVYSAGKLVKRLGTKEPALCSVGYAYKTCLGLF
jgi:hypothetical protein